MTKRVHLSTWKSPAAEQKFRELEDGLARDLVDEPPAPVDVETRLGPTRVYRWSGGSPPIVFLHGTAGTSLMWARYAERRQGRAVYAVDTIGDVGRSRQVVAVETAEDLAEWLEETLDKLELDTVHVAGTSYGAFLALNLANRRPARVRSLCLIDPAGIVPLRFVRFMVWGFAAMLASLLPAPLRRIAARVLRMPLLEDPRVLRLGLRGALNHRSRLLPPGPFTDEELRSIQQPSLVFVGEKSEVFPSRDVRSRLEALLPHAAVELVHRGGHAVAVSHLEHISDRLVSFLAAQDAASPR